MRPLLLAIGLLPALSGQVGLGLVPMRLDVPVQAGERKSGVLALTNESDTAVRVRVDLLDFQIDNTANPHFASSIPGEARYSCRSWLILNPMEFDLGGGERRLVRYSLRVPTEIAPGGFHCAVGFTTLPPSGDSQSIGMRTNIRVITAFYPVSGQPPIDGVIDDIAMRSGGEFVVTINNTGQRVFRAVGTLDLLDEAGAVIKSQQFPMVPILPARKQPLPVRYEEPLLKRAHRARARVDIGNGEIQEASINLHVQP